MLASLVGRRTVTMASGVMLLWVTTYGLHAQSLDSLRNLLRANNPELRALDYDYQAALAISPQLAQLPDLEIGGGVSILPVETRLGPQRARVMVTQMLPWPGTLAAMAALADAQAQPLLEQAAALQLDLIYQLEERYFEIIAVENKLAVLQEALQLYENLERLTLVRVENSRGSSVDVYRTRLQTQTVQRQTEQLRNEQAQAWAMIEQLVDQRVPRVVTPSAENWSDDYRSDDLSSDRFPLDDHPLIRIFALQEEISRRSVAASDLDARPDFGVGVDYMITGPRTDGDPPGNGRDAILPRVMLRVPISGGKYRAKRQEESLRVRAIDARRRSVAAQLTAVVERAQLARSDAALRLAFLSEQEATAAAALTIARTEYANSRRLYDDLLQLQQQLIDYRLEAIEARRILYTQSAIIDRYLPRR